MARSPASGIVPHEACRFSFAKSSKASFFVAAYTRLRTRFLFPSYPRETSPNHRPEGRWRMPPSPLAVARCWSSLLFGQPVLNDFRFRSESLCDIADSEPVRAEALDFLHLSSIVLLATRWGTKLYVNSESTLLLRDF